VIVFAELWDISYHISHNSTNTKYFLLLRIKNIISYSFSKKYTYKNITSINYEIYDIYVIVF
jgi:hypothetical protein